MLKKLRLELRKNAEFVLFVDSVWHAFLCDLMLGISCAKMAPGSGCE